MEKGNKMNGRIKVIEALAFYTATTGEKIEDELAFALWPDRSKKNSRQNLALLKRGIVTTITLEKVQIICEMCGTDPNFLFNYKTKE